VVKIISKDSFFKEVLEAIKHIEERINNKKSIRDHKDKDNQQIF